MAAAPLLRDTNTATVTSRKNTLYTTLGLFYVIREFHRSSQRGQAVIFKDNSLFKRVIIHKFLHDTTFHLGKRLSNLKMKIRTQFIASINAEAKIRRTAAG